jgi:hypothetical protein
MRTNPTGSHPNAGYRSAPAPPQAVDVVARCRDATAGATMVAQVRLTPHRQLARAFSTHRHSHMTGRTSCMDGPAVPFDLSHEDLPRAISGRSSVHSHVAYTFTGTHITEHTQLHGWTRVLFDLSITRGRSLVQYPEGLSVPFACSVNLHWHSHH